MTKIIKFGGSVIAPKRNPLSVNMPVLIRLVAELSKYWRTSGENIALLHGGGSFGHPLVYECIASSKVINEGCYSRVAYYMDMLNSFVMEALLSESIPAVSMPPRAICTLNNEGDVRCYLEVIESFINRKLVPVSYGDVVLSNEGFAVLSGDALLWLLALKLRADTVIFVTDVDGLYTKDPKRSKEAELIKKGKASEILLSVEGGSDKFSVTGGLIDKIKWGLKLKAANVRMIIVNGLRPGNLYNALVREDGGTTIWF